MHMYSRYAATKIGILLNHFHWYGLYILYHYQVQDYQFYDFILERSTTITSQ